MSAAAAAERNGPGGGGGISLSPRRSARSSPTASSVRSTRLDAPCCRSLLAWGRWLALLAVGARIGELRRRGGAGCQWRARQGPGRHRTPSKPPLELALDACLRGLVVVVVEGLVAQAERPGADGGAPRIGILDLLEALELRFRRAQRPRWPYHSARPISPLVFSCTRQRPAVPQTQ